MDSVDYVGKMKLERNQYFFQLFMFNKNTQCQANATFFPRMNTHVHTDTHTDTQTHTHTHTHTHTLLHYIYINYFKKQVSF